MSEPSATTPFQRLLILILRPVVRLLMRHGVAYQACVDALRWCYVDVATRHFALDGKQSKARIAVLTGLSRVEVDRLQRQPGPRAHDGARSYHRGARVLTAWSTHPEYLDERGVARILPLDGPSPSFAHLVQEYSGGTTPRAVLDECLRVGAVRRHDDRFELVSADFIASGSDDLTDQLGIMGLCGSDLLGTIERNLRPEQNDRYTQRAVQQTGIRLSQVPMARAYIRRHAQTLVEDLDQYLANLAREAQSLPEREHDPVVPRLGAGIYYFQDDPPAPAPELDRRGRKPRQT